MDKELKLHAKASGTFADPADFHQAQFPGQNNSAAPKPRQIFHCQGIMRSHQGGGVHRQLRHKTAAEVQEAEILHNKCISVHLGNAIQGFHCLAQLLLLNQAVHGQIDLFPLPVRSLYHGSDLGKGKIPGQGAGIKGRRAEIDGIRSFGKGRLKGGHGACRGQEFQIHTHLSEHSETVSVKTPGWALPCTGNIQS